MKSYVYYIEHATTREFYIGSRLCRDVKFLALETLDFGIKYKTSSKIVHALGFEHFNLISLQVFDNYDDAYEYEQRLISEHLPNPLCLNQMCAVDSSGLTYKLNRHNSIVSDETKRRISVAKTGVKQSKKRVGVPRSPECRRKISERRRANPTRAHVSRLNATKVICPHCGRAFNVGNYHMHHGDKCKFKDATAGTVS